MQHYDAIIIGAGQAGPPLAGRLTKAGWRIALIERKLLGGTCVNTGCTPTKALVASAYAARMLQRSAEYGINFNGEYRVDMKAVKARKDAIVAKSRNGLDQWLRGMDNCTLYAGHARFTGPKQIAVSGEVLSADHIFLNVGGRASTNNIRGSADAPYFTNSTLLDIEHLPEHLVVVGGSYIGLEFAQIFRRFGSKVTVVEKGARLVSREDEDISAAVRQVLENEGIEIRLQAECIHLHARDHGVAVGLQADEGAPHAEGSHVLLAVGRQPNTDDLGLELTGVTTDSRGFIPVDDQLRTSAEGIYALGDCNGRGAFTHTSYNDFEIVAANLLDGETRSLRDRIPAYALYTDPPLARVGMSESEIRAAGIPALVGMRPMTRVGRAVEKGESQGFMKLLVHAESKQILGAAILGVGGDEAIHCVLDLMYAKAPVTLLQRSVHIHPTVSELIPTIAGELKPLL